MPAAGLRPTGPPWSLVVALGLLLLVELLCRASNPRGVLPVAVADRALAYRELVTELAAYGAPEVVIVGSSRARNAVLAPTLRRALRRDDGSLRVGNFALGGAKAEEVEVSIRRFAELDERPRLIVWPIGAREFETRDQRPVRQVGFLWRPSDWWTARADLGGGADRYLPEALRNEASRISWLARYRIAFQDLVESRPNGGYTGAVRDVFVPRKGAASQMHGGLHPWQRDSRRGESRPVTADRIRKEIGDAYREPEWPNNYQARHLEGAIQSAQKAGIPLLFTEVPTHPLLEKLMPPNTQEKFRQHLRAVARKYRVPFVTLKDLGLALDASDFREQSHVNYGGAQKYTEAIAPFVLKALGPPTASPRKRRKSP